MTADQPFVHDTEKRPDLGDVAARFRPALFALAFDRLGSLEEAADVAQEALVRAVEECGSLRDPAALPAWLRTVATNLCREHWRRDRELPAGLEPPVGRLAEDTHALAVRREMIRQVHRALQELPENNRLALMMHVRDEMPYEDIARFLNVPVTTVEGRIHRARLRLRKQLAEWMTDLLTEEGEDPR
jgi:RNA polymerase sigma-70 factor (ECF subfamily)